MAGGVRLFPWIVRQTGPACNATVLFLHGSGDTGEGVSEWVQQASKGKFAFPNVRVLYPTAPARPYTPMNGGMSNVWFDRKQISQHAPEVIDSIDEMCGLLTQVINEEVEKGVPKSRIVIGGFSMGGCMALHLAYRYHKDVAGVFALSSFINDDSVLYKELSGSSGDRQLPPLFYCHGERDELVYIEWGKKTFDNLSALGVQGKFHSLPIDHELNRKELHLLQEWIEWRLPDLKSKS